MDASLNTLDDKLCQMNTCVWRITRRQVEMGGYTVPSTLVASANESDGSSSANDADDDDATASDDKEDEDASSSSDDKMSSWHSYPLSVLVTKRGSSFGYESSHS